MAIAGAGTQLKRYNPQLTQWEVIAEVNSITGPGMTRETIDTTALDTEGGYRTFIPSFKDAGELVLAMNFTRDVLEIMLADFESDSLKQYEIIFPDDDNTTINFTAFVTALGLAVTTDDKVTQDVTIKISGAPSINSGSGSG